ncbi:MAG TPA: molybdopterin cofactor-binding domain-containing protein [Vicinamibacterales bacterium]|nr:molybdopterin cofactor-binding domain-containing protein [Vicinamibacterales bacterium]
MNRRDFLKSSGALVVSFSSMASVADVLAQAPQPGRFDGPGTPELDAWVAIAADGNVTAYTGKVELGHGLYTSQTQLVAEELCVPLARVKLIQGDTAVAPDQGTTSGSQSHPVNFNESGLAGACATARQALLQMASQRLGVPASLLHVDDGIISGAGRGSLTYAELVGGKKFNLTVDPNAKRKPASEWKILGTSVPRLDIPALATGQFEFVHNVRVPGMLHGRVVRPPEVGATLVRVDESSVSRLPGFVRVVVKKNFVGIVAEKPWQATQMASALKAEWAKGGGLQPQATFYDSLRGQTQSRDVMTVNSKDVDAQIAKASKIVKATYRYPYQMHGAIGTSCAVADVRGGKATIWSATQSVYPTRNTAAMLLGMRPDDVHVIFTMGAGCYGLNGADTVSYDAALMSQAVGRPVRVQLSRKDEMAWENYGTSYVIDQRIAVEGSGADATIIAWDYEGWTPGLGGRPGYTNPGNVITGFLAGAEPAPFAARAATDPNNYANNLNIAPSYVTGTVNGRSGGTGTVRSERVLTHNLRSPFWTGPLRSPERLQNTFAHESIMDEVAAAIAADPVAFRLKHLRDPRLIAVVKAAADAAKWDARPSPQRTIRKSGVVRGRGFSCVLYEGNNGYSAMVADVEVDQDAGKVIVRRFVVAQDCGPISNPDGLKNQLEGGVLQGMSRALTEEVTWDAAKITSIDWRTYPPLYVGAELPVIESVLVNRPDQRATGAGETAITLVAGAIGNAIFDATGARIREAPFTTGRIKAALAART